MEERNNMLLAYLNANVAPILVDFIKASELKGAVILKANVDINELNGHYEGTKYVAPKWYNELVISKENRILVIDKIDSISKEEQRKFIEILEYRKISTFELPENCVIVVTADKINKDTIDEEVFSLLARI